MNSLKRSLVVTAVLSLMLLMLTAVFLLPATTEAQTAVPARTDANTAPDLPPAPAPLNPPIQTPEPNVNNDGVTAVTANSDLEVIPFQPSLHITRGEMGTLSAGANKPTNQPNNIQPKPERDGTFGPDEPYHSPNLDGILTTQGWNLELYDDFEGAFPGNWILSDFGNDGFDRTWGDTSYYSQYGLWSVWPAAGGTNALDPYVNWYSDNLNSWMEYQFDFSGADDIFVNFGLWLDTEESWDWMYFCVSVDFINYSCDYWSGYTGAWTDQAYWLTSYAGYSEVYLAWVFESDDSISAGYEGPFVDAVQVWSYAVDTEPLPTPEPDPNGELILNGSFETGNLSSWYTGTVTLGNDPSSLIEERPSLSSDTVNPKSDTVNPDGPSLITEVGVSDQTAVEGIYSAYLWYNGDEYDFLYQPFYIPSDVNDITINYWFGLGTYETQPGNDWFCASITTAGTWDILVDLGCMDVYYATGDWQEVLFTLSDLDIAMVAGQSVDLNFEMYNQGGPGTGTAAWVDYVRVYATGDSNGASLDDNEPNDSDSEATEIFCDTPINGVIGDAFSNYDEDWFYISNAPTAFDIDIKARTDLVNPSDLDSMLTLYQDNDPSPPVFLDFNDDDGFSYDSFIHYNAAGVASYYIQVESFTGYGGPTHTYELTVDCDGQGQAPPPTDNADPGNRKWTVMLYLNAEDHNFETTLKGYMRNLESFISSKDTFLDILVLYDGPDDGDTERYHIQPNGNYQNGVNYWPRGEVNMGDPDTLAGFAGWAMDLFPAENYYLAIDDHGHGVYGISWDQTNGNDSLTPPEVYSALKDITNIGERKIDIFDYEACLMGMAENAYDVSQWVDYVVFFEQISWGLNTYPNYFSSLQGTDTPLEVGQHIVNTYYNQAVAQGYPHTISLIDTGQMAAVKQASSALADALIATGNVSSVNSARSNSQAFAASDDATNPVNADYIDLWDLADKTAGLPGVNSAATAVKTAVDNAVVHERHSNDTVGGYSWNHDGAHGLSIYYPAFNGSSAFNDYINGRLFRMTEDEGGINGHWDEFLVWAVTTGGNGVTGGIGNDDRKGMTSVRFLQPKFGGDTFIYLPAVLK